MFFWLSKVLWILAVPGNLLLLGLLAAAALSFGRWRRFGRRLTVTLAVATLAIATVPVGGWLISVLENRFPIIEPPPGSIDGIVVLGGVVNQVLTVERGQMAIGGGFERLTELVRLAGQNPDAKIVFSGGSGNLSNQDIKEANVLAPYLAEVGFDAGRLVLENQSRNTHENAVKSLRLSSPAPGERWLLITSAFHMPRAMGCFRQAGWHNLIAYPVDYHYGPDGPAWPMFDLTVGLGTLASGIHEWLGLVFYRVTNRTNALFPGPEPAADSG